MPVKRTPIFGSLTRSSPLSKTHYSIPPSLPPPFGVTGLYDWSASSTAAATASSTPVRWTPYSGSTSTRRSSVDILRKSRNTEINSTLSPLSVSPSVINISPSASSSPTPLFRPSPSPTPVKKGFSEVQLQLPGSSPTPASSPCPPYRSSKPKINSHNNASLPHAFARSGNPDSFQPRSNRSEPRPKPVTKEKRKLLSLPPSDDESSGDDESDYDKDLEDFIVDDLARSGRNGEIRMVRSDGWDEPSDSEEENSKGSGRSGKNPGVLKYIDDAAEDSSRCQSKVKSRGSMGINWRTDSEVGMAEGPWTGDKSGPMIFRKRPKNVDVLAPGSWSYSGDGVSRQSVSNREVGDVHFSPVFSGGSGFDYWVCIGNPERRWVRCWEGQAHPVLKGYVLKPRAGKSPPQWILAQSLRAGRYRQRKSDP